MARRRARGTAREPRGATAPPRIPPHTDQLDLDELGGHEAHERVRCDGGALLGQTLAGLSLRGAVLAGCRLTGMVLPDLELVDVVLRDCDLSGADLSGARLQRVTFERCRLSGLVAADGTATDVRLVDCRAEESWWRMSRLDHCDLIDVDLTGSDWYGTRVRRSRILRSRLDGSELSTAAFTDVALHGSSLAGIRGADLKDLVIGSDQVIELAVALFATRNVVIDDDPDDADGESGLGSGPELDADRQIDGRHG